MNQPTQGPNDRDLDNECDLDNETVDSLNTLKPRAPRLDWDAIRAAQTATDATIPSSNTGPLWHAATGRIAVAWWSGLAAGVAVTFFAMQWLVLRDLQAKIAQLEETVIATSERTIGNPNIKAPIVIKAPIITGVGSPFDLNALLDAPNLSVGSYRGPVDRSIPIRLRSPSTESSSTPGIDDASDSSSMNTPSDLDREIDLSAVKANRLQLIKDVQHDIY